MSEILTINKSDIFFLKLTTPGKLFPRCLSTSEDGFLAILQMDSLMMDTIGCRPLSDDKRYILTQEVVEIDLNFSKSIINVADFHFDEVIKTQQIANEKIYKLLFCENFTVESDQESGCKKFSSLDWSPLDTFFNKSYLAIMTFSGRVIVLSQNPMTNNWEKEYDLLELYQRYYEEHLLTTVRDESGAVECATVHEYIRLKSDLRLTSYSWSSLVRQTRHSRFCLIALLSASGILSLWRIVTDVNESRCESALAMRLDDSAPISVQLCDVSKTHLLVAVFYSDHRIVAIPFSVAASGADIARSGDNVSISQSQLLGPLNRHAWSQKYLTLIVGYESELLVARFADGAAVSVASVTRLPLTSIGEVSSIVVKDDVAYATSRDGHLFLLRLDNIVAGRYELREMLLEPNAAADDSHCCNDEFLDAFVSPNGVHLGVLRISGARSQTRCDIALVRLLPLEDVLRVLLDDYKPLARKQDAMEELRRSLANDINRHEQSHLRELARAEAHWDASSLHSLQLGRYLCMLPGIGNYGVGKRQAEEARLQRLEAIIVCRNISYRLDSFADLSAADVQVPDDCRFVAVLCARLALAVSSVAGGNDCEEIADAIEAARSNARTLLAEEWADDERTDAEMEICETMAREFECPMCGHCSTNTAVSSGSQNKLLARECPYGHVVALCCKTLEIVIDDSVKSCGICGALELWVDSSGLSNWRLGIINSNCPLCDGKFTKLKF